MIIYNQYASKNLHIMIVLFTMLWYPIVLINAHGYHHHYTNSHEMSDGHQTHYEHYGNGFDGKDDNQLRGTFTIKKFKKDNLSHLYHRRIGENEKNDDENYVTRCIYENPSYEKMRKIDEDIENYRLSLAKAEADEQGLGDDSTSNDYKVRKVGKIITIKVYVHVFYSNQNANQGFMDQSIIRKQISILNDAFSGEIQGRYAYDECPGLFTYGETNRSPVQFQLSGINYIRGDTTFHLQEKVSEDLQHENRIGDCDTLNIFTGSLYFGMALGLSTMPSDCNDAIELDGIRIDYRAFPEMSDSQYNQGDTLVHEIGHWLGLYHPFQGGCSGEGDDVPEIGDGVDDTHPQAEPSYGCPVGIDTCEGDGPDQIHNYMDYSDDCCMYSFTQGQIDRMILVAQRYRTLAYEETPDVFQISATPSFNVNLFVIPPSSEPTTSTNTPTEKPTNTPTEKPTNTPTEKPTNTPTEKPTPLPTKQPQPITNLPTKPNPTPPINPPQPDNNPPTKPNPTPPVNPPQPNNNPPTKPNPTPLVNLPQPDNNPPNLIGCRSNTILNKSTLLEKILMKSQLKRELFKILKANEVHE